MSQAEEEWVCRWAQKKIGTFLYVGFVGKPTRYIWPNEKKKKQRKCSGLGGAPKWTPGATLTRRLFCWVAIPNPPPQNPKTLFSRWKMEDESCSCGASVLGMGRVREIEGLRGAGERKERW